MNSAETAGTSPIINPEEGQDSAINPLCLLCVFLVWSFSFALLI